MENTRTPENSRKKERKPLNTEENEAPVLRPKLLTKSRRPGTLATLQCTKMARDFLLVSKGKG